MHIIYMYLFVCTGRRLPPGVGAVGPGREMDGSCVHTYFCRVNFYICRWLLYLRNFDSEVAETLGPENVNKKTSRDGVYAGVKK